MHESASSLAPYKHKVPRLILSCLIIAERHTNESVPNTESQSTHTALAESSNTPTSDAFKLYLHSGVVDVSPLAPDETLQSQMRKWKLN